MLPFGMKPRGLPSDLPLSDILPLEEYIGTSSSYWKIYRTKLVSTGTEVSVFVFDKVACNKYKQQKKAILRSVWKHVDMIQNIQKYSSVTLKIILTAKENRKYIAYATEPVIGSLSNVMGDYPSDISQTHTAVLEKVSFCEMEIKYGVVTIAETLSYLHLYEAMIHCDVSPRNIIVCSNGSWRLSGFHFVMRTDTRYQLEFNHKPNAVTSDFLQPDINFCAPCLLMGAPTQESDIFSLGMLITYVYNQGISLIESTASTSIISQTSAKHVDEQYNKRISSAYNAIKSKIPAGLQLGLSKIISFDVDVRPTAQQLLMLGYYHDPLIKYMKRINLYENLPDTDQEVVLSIELPHCARDLPQTMLFYHVMPIITQEVEAGNRCAGVVQTLMACLGRTLTSIRMESVCKLINTTLDVKSAEHFTLQGYTILMENILLLYNKSVKIGVLRSPLPLLLLGLDDPDKLSSTLSAVSQLSKHPQGMKILTPEMIVQIKRSFEHHWKHGRSEACSLYVDSVLVWLLYIQVNSLTEDICRWLVKIVRSDFDALSIVRRALMTMLSQCDSYALTQLFVEKELSPSIENLTTAPQITQIQRQTLVQLARYAENIIANFSTSVVDAPAPTDVTPTFSIKRSPIRRQTTTATQPPELNTPPVSPQSLPMFSLVITKPVNPADKPLTARPSRTRPASEKLSSSSSASPAERRRNLFQMDLSPNRGKNRSFGELMADIDDRTSHKSELKQKALLSKDNRAASLQVSSSKEEMQSQGRRSSLQPEHYQSLGNLQPKPLATSPTNQQSVAEESPTPKTDVMQSILQRLDSLTKHFNSKGSSSAQ